MNRILFGLLPIVAFISIPLLHASSVSPLPPQAGVTCEEDILAADAAMRATTLGCVREAAARAGRTILTDDIVIASRGDVLVANTAIAGINTLPIEAFYEGTDILFIYINPKDGHAMELGPGFYTAHLQVDRDTKQGTVDFLDENNRLALRTSAVEIYPDTPERGIDVKVTGSIRPNKVVVDVRITFGSSDVEGPTYEVVVSIHDRA